LQKMAIQKMLGREREEEEEACDSWRYLGYFSDWLIAGKVWHRIWPWIPTPCDANKTNQKQNRPIATAAQSEINRKNCAISIIHKRRRPKRGFGREIHWPLSRIMGLSMSKEGRPQKSYQKRQRQFQFGNEMWGNRGKRDGRMKGIPFLYSIEHPRL